MIEFSGTPSGGEEGMRRERKTHPLDLWTHKSTLEEAHLIILSESRWEAGVLAQLTLRLPGMQEALDSVITPHKPGTVPHAYNPSNQKIGQKNQKFKAILRYISSWLLDQPEIYKTLTKTGRGSKWDIIFTQHCFNIPKAWILISVHLVSIKDIMGYLLMLLKEDKSYEKYTYNARYLEHIASEIPLKKIVKKILV